MTIRMGPILRASFQTLTSGAKDHGCATNLNGRRKLFSLPVSGKNRAGNFYNGSFARFGGRSNVTEPVSGRRGCLVTFTGTASARMGSVQLLPGPLSLDSGPYKFYRVLFQAELGPVTLSRTVSDRNGARRLLPGVISTGTGLGNFYRGLF